MPAIRMRIFADPLADRVWGLPEIDPDWKKLQQGGRLSEVSAHAAKADPKPVSAAPGARVVVLRTRFGRGVLSPIRV